MTIPVDCPHCETRFQLSPEMAGKSMRCPECREVFVVQSAATPVEVPPANDRPFERIESDDFAAPVPADQYGSWRLVVDAPRELARFIAPKGSIAIDGVSLTVNEVERTQFAVNLIPHTLAVTTLKSLADGDRVNLEIDLIARYVARLHETP